MIQCFVCSVFVGIPNNQHPRRLGGRCFCFLTIGRRNKLAPQSEVEKIFLTEEVHGIQNKVGAQKDDSIGPERELRTNCLRKDLSQARRFGIWLASYNRSSEGENRLFGSVRLLISQNSYLEISGTEAQ